jgi:DNA-binding winged helix-turn-helix (wHTH) protein
MISAPQQKFLTLLNALDPQPKPKTRDEALAWIASMLHQGLGELPILFYLIPLPFDTDPLTLVPCLARPLSANVFVHENSDHKGSFNFKMDSFYYAPLMLNNYNFGYLFMESDMWPLTRSGQLALALLSLETARLLNELRQPNLGHHRPDSSVPLRVEPGRRLAWFGETPVYMSDKEVIFLDLLNQWRQRGQPCPHTLLSQAIYKTEASRSGERPYRLDDLVSRLRDKLAKIAGQPVSIKTIRGVGYQLCFRSAGCLHTDRKGR